jgi:distribution and morphology protein 10
MLGFMDYIQNAFHDALKWNRDNSYSSLTYTAQCKGDGYAQKRTFTYIYPLALLEFDTPTGIKLHVSSLPSPNFATSYTIANTGLVDGSLSYLYTSLQLLTPSKSTHIPLRHVIRGYRHIGPISPLQDPREWEIWHSGTTVDKKDTLMYGRIFLPQRRLEALYLRRLSPTRLFKISAVSDGTLPGGGTVLGELKNDYGKYTTEYLYSTDSALLGFRGLYNFGPDPRERTPMLASSTPSQHEIPTAMEAKDISFASCAPDDTALSTPLPGLFSLGTELYYGLLNSTLGFSAGLRFTTICSPPPTLPSPLRSSNHSPSTNSGGLYPGQTSFPYTMTLTLNPLMGNLSSTYAVKAGENLALCSKFDFNFYSYESGVQVGAELWRMRSNSVHAGDAEWARRLIRPDWLVRTVEERSTRTDDEDIAGVLKARVDHNWRIGLLWEGRFKEILYSVGTTLDLKKRERVFRGLGVEVAYSS